MANCIHLQVDHGRRLEVDTMEDLVGRVVSSNNSTKEILMLIYCMNKLEHEVF